MLARVGSCFILDATKNIENTLTKLLFFKYKRLIIKRENF